MDVNSAESLLLDESQSDELIAALSTVAETTVDGVEKFPFRTCRELARVVVCRAYAPAILEACHLVVVASATDAAGGRYEPFFWSSGPARTSAFRAHIEGARHLPPAIRPGASEVTIDYGDGSFTVTYGRMVFLSALVEFLMTALGYAEMDRLIAPLIGAVPAQAAVAETANAVSRRIYDYLKSCLPTAQAQRKTRSIMSFFARRAGGELGPGDIDDDAILAFWLEASSSGGDFRAYRTAFQTAIHLVEALERARDRSQLARPRTIGPDREAGEVDPAEVLEAVTAVDERPRLIDLQTGPPAGAVKFLNRRETEVLENLLAAGGHGRRLARSLLRNAVFGHAQARITNFMRARPAADAVASFIATAAEGDYAGEVERYRRLRHHIERVSLATLHALIRLRADEAVTLLLGLRPEVDLAPITARLAADQGWGKTVVALRGHTAVDRLLDRLNVMGGPGGELDGIATEARAAFRALSRKGFSDDALREGLVREAFAAAVAPLLELRTEVARLVDGRLAAADWNIPFAEDRATFEDQFRILYGGAHGPRDGEA